jgi:hypothetical protein
MPIKKKNQIFFIVPGQWGMVLIFLSIIFKGKKLMQYKG